MKRHSKLLLALGALVLLLFAARVAAPFAIESFLESKIEENPDYEGDLEDVDLAVFLGSIEIRGLRIQGSAARTNFVRAMVPRIRVNLSWMKLFTGVTSVGVLLDRPFLQINLADLPEERPKEEPKDEEVSPLEIKVRELEIRDAKVELINPVSTPNYTYTIPEFDLLVQNLNVPKKLAENDPAQMNASAEFVGGGTFKLGGKVDPFAPEPRLDLTWVLENFALPPLNPVLMKKANLDLKSGELNASGELAASDGKFQGFLRPLIKNLDFTETPKEANEEGLIHTLWQSVAQLAANLLENPRSDSITTDIEFSGELPDLDIDRSQAIASAIFNAFIKALSPQPQKELVAEPFEENKQ